MNPHAGTLRAKKRGKLAPYVVVDDGRVSGKPQIALVRHADVAEIAHVVRALSVHAGAAPDAPEQKCDVRLNGFTLSNSLGDGVRLERPVGPVLLPELPHDTLKRMHQAAVETRNQRKRRRRAARM